MVFDFLYLAVMILFLNIITSGIIFFAFYNEKLEDNFKLPELVIYALGAGPTTNSLVLYYLLMLFPHP